MPKVTYTKAKGLIQETGTGFIHTEVPLVQEAKVVAPKMPIYTITVGADGEATDGDTFHNAVITIRLSDGSKVNLVLDGGKTGTLLAASEIPGGGSKVDVTLSDPTSATAITTDIGKAIAGLGSAVNTEYAFKNTAGAVSGRVLTIAGLKPHSNAIPSIRLTLGVADTGVSNATRSNSALVVSGLDADSSLGSDNSLPSNSSKPGLISQVKSATSMVVACHSATDIASTGFKKHDNSGHDADTFALTGLTLEDGTANGQRCYLINKSELRRVVISGKFTDTEGNSIADTKCRLDQRASAVKSSAQMLIWNGSRWALGPHNCDNGLLP